MEKRTKKIFPRLCNQAETETCTWTDIFFFFSFGRPSKLFSLQKGHLNYGRRIRRYSVRVSVIREVSSKKFSYKDNRIQLSDVRQILLNFQRIRISEINYIFIENSFKFVYIDVLACISLR